MILENLLNKYKKLTSYDHIIWMCFEIPNIKINSVKELFKINRWLGFIQGYLFAQKMRNIEELKNETRGIDDEFLEKLNKLGVLVNRHIPINNGINNYPVNDCY